MLSSVLRRVGPTVVALALLAPTLPSPAAAQSEAGLSPAARALGDLQWREIGPANMGGRVTAVAGITGDPKTFWIGGADGGLWKTSNGGTTFEPQWQDEESYSVGAVAVAPSDPNVVWLGSGEGDPRNSVSYGLGVWRSTDGGGSWTHVGLEGTERIKRVVVHPTDPDVALVCALGRQWGPNADRGVFRTLDGGASWDKVLYIDEDTGCSDLDIDLSNPRNVYAGMWTHRRRPWRFDDGGAETALYVSRDGGSTWSKITTTPDEPMARPGISVAQSSPNVLYLVTEYATAGTLFRSDDYGATWAMINDDRNLNFRPFYYSDVFADPNDENTLYVLSGGLSKSTDGGRTFQRIARDVHGDHQSYWIDPADSDHILSGSDGGFQVSLDGGENFHIWRNMALSQFYHIFVDDRDPYWVCGGLQDNGNWCGPSRTRGGSILEDEWYTVSGGDGFYTVPVPGQPWYVYSNAQGGYFRITDTRSGQTRSIEPHPWMVGSQGQGMFQAKYRFNWDAPIHISPHDPGTVYWGGNVLFRSSDYGYTWDVISPDLTTNDPEKQRDSGGEIYNDNTAAEFHTTILTVAESPIEAGVIWVGTDDGNLQITRNGGDTWTNVRDNVPGLPAEAWIGLIEASPVESGVAFVAVDNHRMDDFTPHVWETRDYGASWRDIAGGLPQDDYAKIIRQHPVQPNLLFVGMERGFQVSLDRGQSWMDLRLNLPRVSVRGIEIERRYNDLVIGTHGRGAFILDDLSPLQSLAAAMQEDRFLFPIRTATLWESWNRDSNLGQSTYQGENPQEGAYINFWLAAEPTADVTIRITDGDGMLVREFEARDAHAGVNRAIWDLRWTGPASAGGGGGGGFGGGGGPSVTPGTYTASVLLDGEEFTESFAVRGDPAVETSTADYAAQLAAGLHARDLQGRLNEMLRVVDDVQEQIEGVGEALAGKDVANIDEIGAMSATAQDELAALEDDLTRPPPRMGYRQYPRLSEQLSFVARGINGPQARPTAGQMQVLGEVETAIEERAVELQRILDETIAGLNDLLDGQARILVNWTRPRPIT